MKKLVFLFTMVLAVSMAMAQKTTTLTQSGYGNFADVYQSSNDYDINTIDANQSGSTNMLDSEQHGYDNRLFLSQTGPNNDAWLDQDGYYNYSEIDQSNSYNYANLDQIARSSSRSYSWQYGVDNDLYVTQKNNAQLQFADSYQNGTSNYTKIRQEGNLINNVVADQLGDDDIFIEQVE